ncbi:hypothetical protein ABK040_005563 [Willaertia magna]
MKSLISLVDSLINATKSEKISWKSNDGNVYFVNIPDSSYEVRTWNWLESETSVSGVSAQLLRNGGVIDNVLADENCTSYFTLSMLYTLALRNANRVNEAVKEIEKALSKIVKKKKATTTVIEK